MWHTKCVDGHLYYINAEHDVEERSLRILVSTLKELWISEERIDEVVDRTRQSNSWIEADTDVLIAEILNLFDESNADVQCCISTNDTRLELIMNSKIAGIEFVFQTALHKCDNSKYAETFTLPFLVTIKNLQYQVKELCKFLENKDVEITEYKMNGATVTRRNVETSEFNNNILNELFTQHVPVSTSKTAEELFDRSVMSYVNQVQPVIQKKLKQSQCVSECKQKSLENQETQPDANEVPNSVGLTDELKRKSGEEVKVPHLITAFQSTKSSQKSKPVKKLKNL